MSDEPDDCVQDAEAGQGQGQEAHASESAPMPSHTHDHPAGASSIEEVRVRRADQLQKAKHPVKVRGRQQKQYMGMSTAACWKNHTARLAFQLCVLWFPCQHTCVQHKFRFRRA